MNPPYSGNLHLKILREAMQHSDNIVNLSPIRWLQDPLAEYKKNSDWEAYKDIRSHIESLEMLSSEKAAKLFQARFSMNLGIYKVTQVNGNIDIRFERDGIQFKPIFEKVFSKRNHCWADHIDKDKVDGIRFRVLVNDLITKGYYDARGGKEYVPDYTRQYDYIGTRARSWIYEDGMQNGTWWSMFGNKNQYTKPEGTPFPLSIKFKTFEEAKNFEEAAKTKMYHFINMMIGLQYKYVPWLSDYTHPWTDADLYAYFGLTPDEIDIIEKEMA